MAEHIERTLSEHVRASSTNREDVSSLKAAVDAAGPPSVLAPLARTGTRTTRVASLPGATTSNSSAGPIEAEIAETVFEPREGGHVYDRAVDGSECRWARVLAYEPPNRVVISWDINPQSQPETDHERTSEVEVRFVPEAPERTRVELEQ